VSGDGDQSVPGGAGETSPQHDHLRHAVRSIREELDRLERVVQPELSAVRATGEHLRPALAAAKGEHRLPVTLVIGVAIAFQILLPEKLAFKPTWLLPALECALSVGVLVASPLRINRSSRMLRMASLTLIAMISLANAWSAALLVRTLIEHSVKMSALSLLGNGGVIYLTNVIVFGLWYWEFDHGGPVARHFDPESRYPDFLFPQHANPEVAPPQWRPTLMDYLYVSFTNATAFSPTDVMPLSRWAKGLMFVQSGVSLVVVALVIARAVNILH
jgi:hypothetical protein